MKRATWISGLAIAALAGAGAWWWFATHGAASKDKEAEADAAPVALVTLAPLHRIEFDQRLNVFGDVASGKPEALSFAQAGRIERLAVTVGQRVRKGDVIAVLENDPAAHAAYAQAASALGFAERERTRIDALFALQLATRSQVDAAVKALQDAQAAMQAQAKLGAAGVAAQLLAPFDGIVASIAAEQGERVAAGAPLVQLGRSDKLRVLLAIEPGLAAQVHAGQAVAIGAAADGTAPVNASITSVQAQIDPKTQMRMATVELAPASQAALVPGMHVQAAIAVGKRAAWAVPRQAVLNDDDGDYVYQAAHGKAVRVTVQKVVENTSGYGIDGKLDAALPVVVQGNYELAPGMALREAGK